MTGVYDGRVNALETEILWSGWEDRPGLWEVFFTVRDEVAGQRSTPEALALARQIVASFLDRGWVELFVTHGPVSEAVYEPVPAADRARVLAEDTSWSWEDGDPLVWFVTTDEGHSVYQDATGPQ